MLHTHECLCHCVVCRPDDEFVELGLPFRLSMGVRMELKLLDLDDKHHDPFSHLTGPGVVHFHDSLYTIDILEAEWFFFF